MKREWYPCLDSDAEEPMLMMMMMLSSQHFQLWSFWRALPWLESTLLLYTTTNLWIHGARLMYHYSTDELHSRDHCFSYRIISANFFNRIALRKANFGSLLPTVLFRDWKYTIQHDKIQGLLVKDKLNGVFNSPENRGERKRKRRWIGPFKEKYCYV